MKHLGILAVILVAQASAAQFAEAPAQGLMRRLWTALPKTCAAVSVRWCSSSIRTPAYADATVDVAFKEMMWKQDNDPVALSFIQTFVPDIQVASVEFLKSAPLAIPALKARGKKQTFMDFHVQSKDGHHYLVEMQSQRHMRFDERSLFYACSVYSRQLEEKHFNDPAWYVHLKPVIAIQVVDYDTNRVRGMSADDGSGIDPNDQDFIARVRRSPLPDGKAEKHFMMTDKHSGQKLDHLQMVQVELPRFDIPKLPLKGEVPSDKNWWVRILKYSDEYTPDELSHISGIPAFVKNAMDRLTFSKWDPVMVQEYKESVVDRGKYSTVLQVERTEGKIEGIAEGELRKAQTVAKASIARGLDNETIAAITGLTLEQVQALRAPGA